MGTGYSSLSFDRLIPVLLGDGTFKEQFILFSIRLPRIVITLLAGVALALSGAILQVVMRNDLADPGIIGINAAQVLVSPCSFYLFRFKHNHLLTLFRSSLFAVRSLQRFSSIRCRTINK